MKRLECEQCGKQFPMNDMVRAVETEKNYCRPCADKAMQSVENPLEGEVATLMDPTVCAYCGADSGSSEFAKVAGLPACERCDYFFRHRPFPAWIKMAFTAVLALVIFSIGWNLRFIQAYAELNDSYKFFAQGDWRQAALTMSSAAQRVPESADLRMVAAYMQGLDLLSQDKPAEALEKLNQCRNRLPAGYRVEDQILQAKIGVAFDSQDYDKFLQYSKSYEQKYPDDFMNKATVASAYACKYAETGDKQFREQSIAFLSRSRELAADNPQFKDYEQRILHRIHSRKIISRQEFDRTFPDGWDANSSK